MSLHHAAQHLKAQGRGPDDQLIHMSGKEVAGLQALAMAHGGTLTINPETGLPEAGFLDNILPTVLGAAGMYFGIDPMTTAMLVGGAQTARTGDLGEGLMAGLGAYGGAGLTQGVMNVGETALAEQAGLGAGENIVASNADKLSTGASNVLGPDGWFNLKAGMPAGGMSALTAAGTAAAPVVMGAMQPGSVPASVQDRGMIRPYEFSYNSQTPKNPEPLGAQYQAGQDTSERTWFKPSYTALPPYRAAGGGLMGIADDPSSPVQKFATGGLSDLTRMVTGEDVMPMDREKQMAGGGMSSLGGYASGGNPRLLKGPGDGMSDNIPAVIGAKQPARLADGEFVVPADVVSHLGNGSTDAGAKQLYKMMDRIRQQRTGKKKQAPQVNPAKAMPA